MKKAHVTLLIVTAILALSSAYSLAAMNQVFKVDMEWFSQLTGQYSTESRDASEDSCSLPTDKLKLQFLLADNRETVLNSGVGSDMDIRSLPKKGWYNYLYVFCSLGEVNSPEYRIKIIDIAQRGNNVEVKVSINTPSKLPAESTWKAGQDSFGETVYHPQDSIRIKKGAFPTTGRLYFIFKNQDGKLIYEQYFDI